MLVHSVFTIVVMTLGYGGIVGVEQIMDLRTGKGLALILGSLGISLLYYSVLEGIWGATVGKAFCGLRVVGKDNSPPGFCRALPRALIYVILPVIPYWVIYGGNMKAYLSSSQFIQPLVGLSNIFIILLLFSSVRRRNGFAALHDLITGTRVISRAALQSRPTLAVVETVPAEVTGRRLVGPYHVLEVLEKSAAVEWLLGYDLKLLRKVWIRVVPPGTLAVPAALRNIGRFGRLRWLTGRRTEAENWDAFEAVSGKPLVELIRSPQPWKSVRFWLYDLANEISAAEKDGTTPTELKLDRVWITADGRVKLLDFPAPGTTSYPHLPANANGRDFLNAVAIASVTGNVSNVNEPASETRMQLPLHTKEFLKNLPRLAGVDAVAAALKPLLTRVTEISRLRRAMIVFGCLLFPIFGTCAAVFGQTMMKRWQENRPGLMDLNLLLHMRHTVNTWPRKLPHPTDQQFGIFIAQHYSGIITNEASWSDVLALTLIKGEARQFAEQSITNYPAPTQNEISEAETAVTHFVPNGKTLDFSARWWFVPMVFGAALGIYVCLPAVLAALICRGGLLLKVAGVTFVRRDGILASRVRVLWRSLVAWSPLIATPFIVGFSKVFSNTTTGMIIAGSLCAGLTVVSIILPKRGLPDMLAGTWPVAR
jgi:uncharacterized RDD family membrane protein YckC